VIGFATEVSKRIATHWLTAVLLPGLLLVAVAASASVLGHAHALDLGALDRAVAHWPGEPKRWVVRLALAAALAGVLGVTARGTGRLVQRFWLRERQLVRFLPDAWSRHHRALAAARRQGIEPVRAYLPQRPTWMGDRLRLVEARVRAQYRFSAAVVWPRLWLLTPDEVHAPLRATRSRFDEACVLAGWALLYVVLGVFWWPAALIGVVTGVVAWRRARSALDEFATLVEAAIDVHWRTLAAALGIGVAGETITAAEAALIQDGLQKGSPV
jgi:hypothetical protein